MNSLVNFVFFDETSTSATSNIFDAFVGGEELELQVTSPDGGTPSLTVEGLVDIAGGQWSQIAVISIEELKVYDSISADGIYAVPANAVKKFRIQNNNAPGSVRVYGMLTGSVN